MKKSTRRKSAATFNVRAGREQTHPCGNRSCAPFTSFGDTRSLERHLPRRVTSNLSIARLPATELSQSARSPVVDFPARRGHAGSSGAFSGFDGACRCVRDRRRRHVRARAMVRRRGSCPRPFVEHSAVTVTLRSGRRNAAEMIPIFRIRLCDGASIGPDTLKRLWLLASGFDRVRVSRNSSQAGLASVRHTYFVKAPLVPADAGVVELKFRRLLRERFPSADVQLTRLL